MSVLAPDEREAIRAADEQLGELQLALETAAEADALDRDSFVRAEATARDVVARVNRGLPLELDAETRDEIRRRLITLWTADVDEEHLLDVADEILLEVEAVRHIFRDVLTEQPAVDQREAAAVIEQLEAWLPGLTVKQLAELLGMSERALQRRRSGDGVVTSRAQMVLRLVAILRHGWTDVGVLEWFRRPRSALGDRTPEDLLDDRAAERQLIELARSGRVQIAS